MENQQIKPDKNGGGSRRDRQHGRPPILFQHESWMSNPEDFVRDAVLPNRAYHRFRDRIRGLLPGILLTSLIAMVALIVSRLIFNDILSPAILAMAAGSIISTEVAKRDAVKKGILFSMRRALRVSVVLLGLQLSTGQLVAVGVGGLLIAIVTMAATFFVTIFISRLMNVDGSFALLLATGTSVCGAAAIMAVCDVTRASQEDTAYALTSVTVLGTVAMLSYPLLPSLLHLSDGAYGIWAGASIHEIAQVIVAGYQNSQIAGDIATITKLCRVLMLVPIIVLLGALAINSRSGSASYDVKAPFPWFIIGFLLMMTINSAFEIPTTISNVVRPVTGFLMAMVLAALGLTLDVRKIMLRGAKPLLLSIFSAVFISGFSFILTKAFYHG
jgi:uncharacterized integral membrane protein (TIGR00698 family)